MDLVIGLLFINFVLVIDSAWGVDMEYYESTRVTQYLCHAFVCWVFNIVSGVWLLVYAGTLSIAVGDILISLAGLIALWVVGLLVAMRPNK